MTSSILTKVKKYVAISALGLLATLSAHRRAEAIVTVDDPDNNFTTEFKSVGLLKGPQYYSCGASVITGFHLLTAAHCALDRFEKKLYDIDLFELDLGESETFEIDEFILHPNYEYFQENYDIAIIKLAEKLPDSITRYEIYRDDDEFGKIADLVGYGAHGTGAEGVSISDPEAYDFQKRVGQNVYEAGGEILNGKFEVPGYPDFSLIEGTTLAYDFDSGDPKYDAFGKLLGGQNSNFVDLGLGINEASGSWGDSGSPILIDGKIAGITSFGIGDNWIPALGGIDLIPDINSSFGEIRIDTRVSYYADWIDKVASVPEPSTLVGLVLVVGAGSILKRKKRNRD